MSDIVGTVLLLGVTVAIVGIAAVELLGTSTEPEPPAIDVATDARLGDAFVTLTHVGGLAIDRGDLRVVVSINGAFSHDAPLGAAGTPWALGESVAVPVGATLLAGQNVEVVVVSVVHGATLTSATLHVPAASPSTLPPGTFTVAVTFDSPTTPPAVKPPAGVLIHAFVTHPQGRQFVREVLANMSDLGGDSAVPLMDDGAGGDGLAGDSWYSAYGVVPLSAVPGDRVVRVTAYDIDGASSDVGEGHVIVIDPIFSLANFTTNNFFTTGNSTGGNFTGGNISNNFYTNGTSGGGNFSGGSFTNGSFSGGSFTNGSSSGGSFTNGSFSGGSFTNGTFTGNFTGNFTPYMDPRNRQVYNKSLIIQTGHRILKREAGPHDQLTVHLKMQLVGEPIMLIDGQPWHLANAAMAYYWMKPGGTPPIALDDAALPGSTWHCYDPVTKVVGFKAINNTINTYSVTPPTADALYYYIGLVWQNTVTGAVMYESINTAADDEFFILGRTGMTKVIQENGWPTNFDDCSL